jgi:hypothetical protein
MVYLHGMGRVHRDLKCLNIFLTGDLTVKVCQSPLLHAHPRSETLAPSRKLP